MGEKEENQSQNQSPSERQRAIRNRLLRQGVGLERGTMEWFDMLDDFEKGVMITFAIVVIFIVVCGFAFLISLRADECRARKGKRNDKRED